ncbi:helix-turn-helix transcriptional regulator [Nocardia callitridis]|uniref:Helix-turn-helix transcriptional regulator n=2 Tax=Nocardia callitridis TaxID=648753 RepID=A0ABP9K2Y2_9NOCA
MQWSESTLQRLETGNAEKIRWRDVRELCQLYDVSREMTAALVGLAQQAHVKSWWHEFGELIPENFSVYVGLESSARTLTAYQPDLVPGLLQTVDYARILASIASPTDSAAELAGRAQIKVRRQSIVTRSRTPATLEVVVHEAAIRRVVGNPQVMAAQLRHMADASTMPNVTIRVLPFAAGTPLGASISPFVILAFGESSNGKPVEPTVVYLENLLGDLYLEKPVAVDRYYHAHQALQAKALNEVATREAFRKIAREYENER